MSDSQDKRIKKVYKKFGENAFKRWGKKGGSPILKAWARKHKRGK